MTLEEVVIQFTSKGMPKLHKDVSIFNTKLRNSVAALRDLRSASRVYNKIAEANRQTATAGKQIVDRLKEQSTAARKAVKTHVKGFTDVEDVLMSTKHGIRNLDTEFKAMGNRQKNLRKEAKAFKMEYLGIMFAGMALQRAVTGLFTAGFRTFNMITEGTQLANNSVNQLRAGWEFFKFSLISALMSNGLFISFIKFLTDILDMFSNLSEKTKGWIGIILLTIGVLGGMMFVGGQIALAMNAIKIALLGVGVAAKTVDGIMMSMKILALAAAILVVFAFVKDQLTKMKEEFGSWGGVFKVLAGRLGMALTFLFQSLVNGLIIMLTQPLRTFKWMLEAIRFVMQYLGKKTPALDKAISGLSKITDYRVDLMTPAAIKLDELGFSERAVLAEQRANQEATPQAAPQETITVNTLVVNAGDSFDPLSTLDSRTRAELERQGITYGGI